MSRVKHWKKKIDFGIKNWIIDQYKTLQNKEIEFISFIYQFEKLVQFAILSKKI